MNDSDDNPNEPSESEDVESSEGEAITFDEVNPLDDEDDSLGQSEIDDLFGISMDDDDDLTGLEALVNNAIVRHKRLPTLEACIERLVRSLTNSMRKFTAGNVELSLAESTSIRFGNYIDSIPLPTLISIYKVSEWGSCGLITIDSPMIYSIIDVLLGGRNASKSLAVEGRSFTKIEAMLIKRMINLILDEMTTAFEPLSKVHFQHERLESTPSRAMIVHPSDKAALFKVDIDMDNQGGCVEILLPYATLEPLSSILHQMFQGDKSAQASIWQTHLADETLLAETELEVLLSEQMVPLKTIMGLEVGETLQLSSKPDDLMVLRCGDTPLMQGKVGRVGDKMAIVVDAWFSQADRQIARSGKAA